MATQTITHINTSSTRSAGSTSATGTLPTNWVENNCCLLWFEWNTNPGTVTAPSNWTVVDALANDGTMYAASYFRILRAADVGPAFSWVNSIANRITLRAYSGVDTLNPIDAHTGITFGTTSTDDPGTITTVNDNAMKVWWSQWSSTATLTTPPVNYVNAVNDSSVNPSYYTAELTQATAGVSASNSSTLSATPRHAQAVISLKPAALTTVINNFQFIDAGTGISVADKIR